MIADTDMDAVEPFRSINEEALREMSNYPTGLMRAFVLTGVLCMLLVACDGLVDSEAELERSLLINKKWTVVETEDPRNVPPETVYEFLADSTFASNVSQCGRWMIDDRTIRVEVPQDTLTMKVELLQEDSLRVRTRLTDIVLAASQLENPGCTKYEQSDFVGASSQPPSGYTETDEHGDVVNEDGDDWRTSPMYEAAVQVGPAYPNPLANADEQVTIPLKVSDPSSVAGDLVLIGFDENNRTIELDREELGQAGSYEWSFVPSAFVSGKLHRVYGFDSEGHLVTYGDLMIQADD